MIRSAHAVGDFTRSLLLSLGQRQQLDPYEEGVPLVADASPPIEWFAGQPGLLGAAHAAELERRARLEAEP
jgi:hypothetical protein